MSRENPFSTRFVRPGAIAYRLPSGRDLGSLAARFDSIGLAGQIVGPHGSGKSTLLADLIRLWEGAGQRVVLIELHDSERRLPLRLADLLHGTPPTLIAVDGYEQLSPRSRRQVRRFCRRHRIGLVVTAHRSMGIPDLIRCVASLEQVRQIVRSLLARQPSLISDDDIRASFNRHEGNVREVLFEMYDLYETREPSQG